MASILDVVFELVDRVEKNGYQMRAKEDEFYEEQQKRIAAEKDRDHWKTARQEAIEAGELMKAEIDKLRQWKEAVQRIIEVIDQLSVVSAGDPDACVEAIGQIRKYFDSNEYPVLKGGE